MFGMVTAWTRKLGTCLPGSRIDYLFPYVSVYFPSLVLRPKNVVSENTAKR